MAGRNFNLNNSIVSIDLTTDPDEVTVVDFTRVPGEYVWLLKKSDGEQVLRESAPDYGAHESNHGRRLLIHTP